jgi:hypothetical protein
MAGRYFDYWIFKEGYSTKALNLEIETSMWVGFFNSFNYAVTMP